MHSLDAIRHLSLLDCNSVTVYPNPFMAGEHSLCMRLQLYPCL